MWSESKIKFHKNASLFEFVLSFVLRVECVHVINMILNYLHTLTHTLSHCNFSHFISSFFVIADFFFLLFAYGMTFSTNTSWTQKCVYVCMCLFYDKGDETFVRWKIFFLSFYYWSSFRFFFNFLGRCYFWSNYPNQHTKVQLC